MTVSMWEKINEAPPRGLMPKRIWQGQRIREIIDALERYSDAGLIAPAEWFAELRILIEEI